MRHVIIGTAGHVDHGKTTLIQALTGTNADRLKEEQERGMTIDLGFASMTLADGTLAGIVDVPGHERFLKNMLAGAGGLDVALLVVAADESVMPQTVEHLDILRILDVKHGVIALTKCNMVEREWLDAVETDIRESLKGTFLAHSPIVRVDSITGKGIPELKRTLLSAAAKSEPKNPEAPFRIPVDRVFTRPGFGTVITGSLVMGTLNVGDAVEIQPQGIATRVRGIQVHGKKLPSAEPGTRVAVNLAGVEQDSIVRGAVLCPPGTMPPTQSFDAVLRLLESAAKPLMDHARVRVYVGSAEVIGRVQTLGGDQVKPGEQGYIQFRAEEPLACARGDRYVVRTYSPMATIGGGIILDPQPPRHKSKDMSVVERLAARERGTPDDLIASWLQTQPLGATRKELVTALAIDEHTAQDAEAALIAGDQIVEVDRDRLIHHTALAVATDRLLNALRDFHEANHLRPGMPKEELRNRVARNADSRAFGALLAMWQRQKVVVVEGVTVKLADFEVSLSPRQQALLDKVVAVFLEDGFNPPSLDAVSRSISVPPDAIGAMVRVAINQQLIVKISDDLHFHRDTIAKAKQLVRDYIDEHGSINVSQFRDATGSSRKFALPLMEYFDQTGFTARMGDARVLTNRD